MEKNNILKCFVCGNVVELLTVGGGVIACCNKNMNKMTELSHDAGEEKHVPIVQQIEGGINVHVGSIDHPMQEDHFIEWIEVITKDRVYRCYLSPKSKPSAEFFIDIESILYVREYCNLHGLRKS